MAFQIRVLIAADGIVTFAAVCAGRGPHQPGMNQLHGCKIDIAQGGHDVCHTMFDGKLRCGANDFATYMKLPQTADGFCQMIKDFQTKKVDVGRVNNEYFINVLAAGMLTDIAYKVPKDKKAVLGKMAYYLEGVKEFPKQLSQNMTLTFNSKEYSGTEDIMLFLVANSKSVGGFADAAPLASVSDGYLDVMIIKKMALLTEAPDLIFKLFQGEHPKHPSIEYFQTKELSVLPTEQTAGIAIDYDGEILEEGLPVDISIVPEALNLIILRTTN